MNARYALLDIVTREFADGRPDATGHLYESFRDAEEAREEFPDDRRLAIVRTKILNAGAPGEQR